MFLFVIVAVYKFEYTMRVCIFKLGRRLLAGCCIVYLRFGKIFVEYTLRVCIFFVVFLYIFGYRKGIYFFLYDKINLVIFCCIKICLCGFFFVTLREIVILCQ